LPKKFRDDSQGEKAAAKNPDTVGAPGVNLRAPDLTNRWVHLNEGNQSPG